MNYITKNYIVKLCHIVVAYIFALVLLRIRLTPSELMFGRSANLAFKSTHLPDIIKLFIGKIIKRFAYFPLFI